MSEMIERLARAVAQVRERNGAAPYEGWDTIHGERVARRLRLELFEEVCAMLKAMREPTEAMLDAGAYDLDMTLQMQWERMIDAALAEPATEPAEDYGEDPLGLKGGE